MLEWFEFNENNKPKEKTLAIFRWKYNDRPYRRLEYFIGEYQPFGDKIITRSGSCTCLTLIDSDRISHWVYINYPDN